MTWVKLKLVNEESCIKPVLGHRDFGAKLALQDKEDSMRAKRPLTFSLLGVVSGFVLSALWVTKLNTATILTYAPLIGSLAAVGAAIAAFLAFWATRQTRKASLAQIVAHMRNIYSSPEMLRSMMRLLKFKKEWKKKYGDDWAKQFGEVRKDDYPRVASIDEDRRRFSHYFGTIQVLWELKLIDKEVESKLRSEGQKKFHSGVVKPLDDVIEMEETK